MKKWHFAGLLFGLMVIAGLAFTACPPAETSYLFENWSKQVIVVDAPDYSPSKFKLAAYTGDPLLIGVPGQPDVDSQEASSTKDSFSNANWYIEGDSSPYTMSRNNIKYEKNGTTIKFVKNEDGNGLANIKEAEQE